MAAQWQHHPDTFVLGYWSPPAQDNKPETAATALVTGLILQNHAGTILQSHHYPYTWAQVPLFNFDLLKHCSHKLHSSCYSYTASHLKPKVVLNLRQSTSIYSVYLSQLRLPSNFCLQSCRVPWGRLVISVKTPDFYFHQREPMIWSFKPFWPGVDDIPLHPFW